MKIFKNIILSIIILSFFTFLITNCKEEQTPVTPPNQEPPVYENGTDEIGTIGGTVKVSDPNSPIYSSFVQIPDGALSENKTISISHSTQEVPDPNAIVVNFEPKGLNFSKPVKIGLPYNANANLTNLSAYYYDEESETIEQLNVDSIDIKKNCYCINESFF